MIRKAILQPNHWDHQYRRRPVWETDCPCSELCRVLQELELPSCRAIELGCGTGINAIELAKRGFRVTAVDLSSVAIRQARANAVAAGVSVHWVEGNLLECRTACGSFDFLFDRGCYHAVRLIDGDAYRRIVGQIAAPGAWCLILAGNAHEPEDADGPPVVHADELVDEFADQFDVLRLREFRFDARPNQRRYLGWSCLMRRRQK